MDVLNLKSGERNISVVAVEASALPGVPYEVIHLSDDAWMVAMSQESIDHIAGLAKFWPGDDVWTMLSLFCIELVNTEG